MRAGGTGLAFAALCLATTAMAQDATGLWQSQPGDEGTSIQVEVGPCADQSLLCGTILRTVGPPPKDADGMIGKVMIENMAPDGPGTWAGGTIWAPDEDETYKAKMEMKGNDTLYVSGCILGGLICRGQDWARVR
ncbi:DUF2147 domain-containing protein [Rhodobacteraceae bacterium NNCM2]|nr:DUF2147 domain-containing protein [Coraliihabitans acroporae]